MVVRYKLHMQIFENLSASSMPYSERLFGPYQDGLSNSRTRDSITLR